MEFGKGREQIMDESMSHGLRLRKSERMSRQTEMLLHCERITSRNHAA